MNGIVDDSREFGTAADGWIQDGTGLQLDERCRVEQAKDATYGFFSRILRIQPPLKYFL